MSRWLSSLNQVSSLLEKLDDQVETVVEERIVLEEEAGSAPDNGGSIDDILAKRGLATESKEVDEDKDGTEPEQPEQPELPDVPESDLAAQGGNNETEDIQITESSENLAGTETPVDSATSIDSKESDTLEENDTAPEKTESKAGEQDSPDAVTEPSKENEASEPEATETKEQNKLTEETATKPVPPPPPRPVPPPPPKPANAKPSSSSPKPPPPGRTQKERELTAASKEAQKEARTLRRHVVSLNTQLEAAEAELQAQRKELEQAGTRMQKDRDRAKEQKETAAKKHAEALQLQKTQYESTVQEQQDRFDEQLQSYKVKLADLENRRQQEGGDWSKEISQAFEREQDIGQQVRLLEEEKTVFLSQISTLQAQQDALGSRLESLTEAADNASARERESEDRLDSVLGQHARQISQRQARESELERTIQELNAALVNARYPKSTSSASDNAHAGSEPHKITDENSAKARVAGLENDLHTANAHLTLEREKSEALHQQLREMSKETTQEASAIHVKQLQYDRQIADMSLTISKLQASLRDAQNDASAARDNDESEASGKDDMTNQIKLLSEEVLRLRDKSSNHTSETLTLKSRLQAALDRAAKAEDDLAARSATNGGDGLYDSMERAGASGNGIGRRKRAAPASGSIRSAMQLNSVQGERTEQIAKVVDAVDSFAVTTGKYLRRNPLARAGFIFYLLLIHLWTFFLLFMHAHSFEPATGGYPNAMDLPHGPHAVVQQHKQMLNNAASVDLNQDAAADKAP